MEKQKGLGNQWSIYRGGREKKQPGGSVYSWRLVRSLLWKKKTYWNRFKFTLGIRCRPPERKYCEMACESKIVCDKGKIFLMGDFKLS